MTESCADERFKLRLATYMCPSHPVELYEAILQYLEEELRCQATLLYESRPGGPLMGDRPDPFTTDQVDIAFMTSSSYVKLKERKNKYMELLPVAAVYKHSKNSNLEPGYYSDIIIHVDYKKHVKGMLDLRGCTWAYSNDDSLSGSVIVLNALKQLGENASFFGNTMKSGSHFHSVQMVVTKQAEAAAVDANTLAYNKKYLQDGGKDIVVLDSLGPLPPYPIVINSRLDDSLKTKISLALLNMANCRLWGERLNKFGITFFVTNDDQNYNKERELRTDAKSLSLGVRYY